MFDYTLMDVWNQPAVKVLRFGTKMAVKAAMSAEAKAEAKRVNTSELTDLINKAHNGDSNAQFSLALYNAENQDFNNCIYWLKKSAKQGNGHALGLLDMLQED